MKKQVLLTLSLVISLMTSAANVEIWKTGTLQNGYTTLKSAFDAINAGTCTGDLDIKINASTTETASAVLNASATGSASYTSVHIYPTAAGFSISGNLSTPLINLNGADNVTIDGRVNGVGAGKSLTVSNSNGSYSDIDFNSGATNNTVEYCTLGLLAWGTASVVHFGAASNNIVDNNNINSGEFGIYCDNVGGASNIISNNNIYNFTSRGVLLGSGVGNFTIKNNSFYQTTSAGSVIIAIQVVGSGMVVSGNYIGGSGPLCTGNWSQTSSGSTLYGIYSTLPATITGNTIRSISFTTSSSTDFTEAFLGITAPGGSTINSNTISGITTANSATSDPTNFTGINITDGAGTTTVNENTISTISCASISSGHTQTMYGIYSAATGTVGIAKNTIDGLVNATTFSNTGYYGRTQGIFCSAGTNAITDNAIKNLSISNANFSKIETVSIGGVVVNTTSVGNAIQRNTISGLTNPSALCSQVFGVYLSGGAGSNSVSNNFIRDLASYGAGGVAEGIYLKSAGINAYNNIISLANTYTKASYVTGIEDLAGSNLYYNTVNVGGTGVGGESYGAILRTNSSNCRNNIFNNSRSSNTVDYAIWLAATGGTLNLDYNDYYAPATSGRLGYIGAVKTALPLVAGLDAGSRIMDPQFTSTDLTVPASFKPKAKGIVATPISGYTADYAATSRAIIPTIGAYEGTVKAAVEVYGQATNTLLGGYTKLALAFAAINAGTHTGALDIRITDSTTETASAVLNASTGSASYTAIHIYPAVANTALSISGNLSAPLIDLNGANNVTIDGRVNGTGLGGYLYIANSNTGAGITSTIRFSNDASNNTVQYCTIQGAEKNAASGVVFFSTGTTTGNDNNIIDNNSITSYLDTARPYNAVYSAGTAGKENTAITISNNKIYDFFNPITFTNGVNFASNSTGCTIQGNSFYEKAPFTPTGTAQDAYTVIVVACGANMNINNNYIGGSGPGCAGTWTKTDSGNNPFYGINLSATTSPVVQDNVIAGFNWTNKLNNQSDWYGINSAVAATVTGNTIGSATGTITFQNGVNGGAFRAITAPGGSTIDNNNIAYITAKNYYPGDATHFMGINVTAAAGPTSLSGNTIDHISCTSTAVNNGYDQWMYGIYSAATGVTTIGGNVITNLANASTNAYVYRAYVPPVSHWPFPDDPAIPGQTAANGLTQGIYCSAGDNTVSNNMIHDLTIANRNEQWQNQTSVAGVLISATSPSQNAVTGNTVYNLSNTYDPSGTTIVYGVYLSGGTGANSIGTNFVHDLTADSPNGYIAGIRAQSAGINVSNNIVSLKNTGTNFSHLVGIFDTGGANVYYNTVNIGGSSSTGTYYSTCLYREAANTCNYRNNILNNTRTNTGTAKNYAFVAVTGGALTLDYNDYYVSSTNPMLGYYGADVPTLPLVSGQDANSQLLLPQFTGTDFTVAASFKPKATGIMGAPISGYTADYAATPRATGCPTMGAYECTLTKYPVEVCTSTGEGLIGYTNLGFAFDAINKGVHTGVLDVRIKSNTNQSVTAVLNSTGINGADYSSIHLYPTAAGLSITGGPAGPLIDLNGADNVTIDGSVGGTGGARSLVIANTSTSNVAGTSTIRFIADATNNVVKNCSLKGSETAATGGVVFFSTGGTAVNNNNSNNIITNNYITAASIASTENRPVNAVYSYGTSTTYPNAGITISNNDIYNFLSLSTASHGVNFAANTTACTVSGNSFYETTTFAPTAAVEYDMISIAAGDGYTIRDNQIGGSDTGCGGTWTKKGVDNVLKAIELTAGSLSNKIDNNKVTNINWTNTGAASWYGVNSTVPTTVTGNIIGSPLTSSSITLTNSGNAGFFYGVYVPGGSTISNNTVAGITTANSNTGYSTRFAGIYITAGAGTTTVSKNSIGSSVGKSIWCSSPASTTTDNNYEQWVNGIISQATGTTNITENNIANLANATTNTNAAINSRTHGISCYAGNNIVTGNMIHDLSTANGSTQWVDYPSIAGVIIATPCSGGTIKGNTIYNLKNTYASRGVVVYGVDMLGGGGTIANNFIHDMTVAHPDSWTIGIRSRIAGTTVYNNIISLTNMNTNFSQVYGIWDTGGSNVYYNTVNIGGSSSSGASRSVCLYSEAANTRDYQSNILTNTRTYTTGSAKNYALFFAATGGSLILDRNDYYVSGIAPMAGYYGADLPSLPLGPSSSDASSQMQDPLFTGTDLTVAASFKPKATAVVGATIDGYSIDYAGTTRATFPTMGAYEGTVKYPVEVYNRTTATLTGRFPKLSQAFLHLIASDSQDIKINSSITESASAVLNDIRGAVHVYPTVAGISISGNLAAPLINLHNTNYVTIDGSVGGTGTDKSLTIVNNSASATAGTSTICFSGGNSRNTVKNCIIRGAETAAASGVVFFGGSSESPNNAISVIDNNDITSASTRPVNGVYSASYSTVFHNSGITVSNNNIYDFLNPGIASNGVNFPVSNEICTVSGNSFYETTPFAPTAGVAYNVINVASGTDMTVKDNYIGGSAPKCGGIWKKSNANNNVFAGINLSVATLPSVQGNTIKGFDWSNSGNAYWYGVNSSVAANIGNVSGNTIGSTTATSITLTNAGHGGDFHGLSVPGGSTISNNTIAGITTANTNVGNGTRFAGVWITATAGTTTVSNNTIGSTTMPQSIWCSSAATTTNNDQWLFGIYSLATGTTSVSGNTIANLVNASPNGSKYAYTHGIDCRAGANTISGNTIHDLNSCNPNVEVYDLVSVGGIMLNTSTANSVNDNIIYNLANTNANTGNVTGIYYTGDVSANNTISRNFIHDLLPTIGEACGVKLYTGVVMVSNNIISLTNNLNSWNVIGISDRGSANQNTQIYYNTVSIGGTSINKPSYCLLAGAASNTRNYRNNIFLNTRSTSSTSNNYALYLNGIGSLTLDYNDYYVTGTRGVLGYSGGDIDILPFVTGKDANSKKLDPGFVGTDFTTPGSFVPKATGIACSAIPEVTTDYTGDTRGTPPTMGAYEGYVLAPLQVFNRSTGTLLKGYSEFKSAFDAINEGKLTGALDIRINTNITGSASAVLYQSGYNSKSNYSSIHVYPVVSGLTFTGNLAAPLIDLNGADSVIIDGRVNGAGARDLVIVNNSTSNVAGTSTIRFINDASNNIVRYCKIQGAETNAAGGVVFFSTGAASGNDNNTLDNNSITSASATTRPINAVYSAGSAGYENSSITISNNNIYDFLNLGAASNGVNFAANSTACTVSGNSFYETTSFAPTTGSTYSMINVNSGSGFSIRNNYIGGSAAQCSGTWTKNANDNPFYAINLGTGTASPSVQGNTVAGFDWQNSNAASWYGIYSAVVANIGTVTGNIIGSTTGSYLKLNNANHGGAFQGITAPGGSSINNNTIASIFTNNLNTGNATHFRGIIVTAAAGPTSIKSNTISNIWCSSAATNNGYDQSLYGIYSAATGATTIDANVITNLANASANSYVYRAYVPAVEPTIFNGWTSTPEVTAQAAANGLTQGIYCSAGDNTVSNNMIHDLTIANRNEQWQDRTSVAGVLVSASSGQNAVTGNTVYNLSNTCVSGTTIVYGAYLSGGTGTNSIGTNFVHDLTANSSDGCIAGIRAQSAGINVSNNIVSLKNTDTNFSHLFGIFDTGGANVYYNTVNIGGSSSTGTYYSTCLYREAANTCNYRNNILNNTRTTTGNAKNYAFVAATGGALTLDYNDYYVSGTNPMLGYYSADVPTLPLVSGQDAYSQILLPQFTGTDFTVATSFKPKATGVVGTPVSNYSTDYASVTRATSLPTMGAYEGAVKLPVEVYNRTTGTRLGGYAKLKYAFDAINNGIHKGVLDLKVNSNTIETAAAVLNASSVGSSSYTSVHIYPTVADISINGNLATPLIDVNGADSVMIDGRINGTGAPRNLTIINSSTSATAGTSTIRFVADATKNIVKNCIIKGAETNAASGVVFFSTSATGNNYNVIDNNEITSAASRPYNAVYSAGTVGKENNSIIISNNEIYNFFNPITFTYGVNFASNSTACTVENNSFYEKDLFVPTGTAADAYTVINVACGSGMVIRGNYIGGKALKCDGGSWTKKDTGNNPFYGINLSGTTSPSVQGNTIAGFDWSNSGNASWYGINSAVVANIGNITANTIGSATATSIRLDNGSTGGAIQGITAPGGSTISKNTVAGITASNDGANATCFKGISVTAGTATAITTVNDNIIGSTMPNSIFCWSVAATSSSSQWMYGIYSVSAGTTKISGNTIANLENLATNASTASVTQGIYCSAGTNTITGNTIKKLHILASNPAVSSSASVAGISLASSAYNNTVQTNVIDSLNARAGHVVGLFFNGNGSVNNVSGNFIHSLSSVSGDVYAVCLITGNTRVINNIVYLGGANINTLYGIYDKASGGTSNNTFVYHNTVYIDGNPSGNTKKSYCLYSAASTNLRDYRNNMFYNKRSSSGTNYAAYFDYTGNSQLTLSNNNYYTPGTGGVLARYNGADITSGVSSLGSGSLSIEPQFLLEGSTEAFDYTPINVQVKGATGIGILTDYAGITRVSPPTMGALEGDLDPVLEVWTSTGKEAEYGSLRFAFIAINAGRHTGALVVKMKKSSPEGASAILKATGVGKANYSSLWVYPLADISISGDLAAPLIDLNGASNVTIDGRSNGTGGISMSINNNSQSSVSGTSTIRFTGGASNNTVKYCGIQGAEKATDSGVLYFAPGATTGNNNNTIDNNSIYGGHYIGNSRPINVVYSAGLSATCPNMGNVISNNNIWNFLNRTEASNGINFFSNSKACKVSGNSFSETGDMGQFIPTAAASYSIIKVSCDGGSVIENNYIGGSQRSCAGFWIKSGSFNNNFNAIDLSGSTTTANSVQGNTIKNISWTNSGGAFFKAISSSGLANIGTVSANTIGSDTGTGAIKFSGSGVAFYGIEGDATSDIRNNVIGAITVASNTATASANFAGIYLTDASASTTSATVSNNRIGSTTTANSIQCSSVSSASVQTLYGIYSTAQAVVSNNTISNLTNSTTNSVSSMYGCTQGILSTRKATVTGNTIYKLSIANANAALDTRASVAGILLSSTTDANVVRANIIHDLANLSTGHVMGLYYAGGGGTSDSISTNFIHSLASASGNLYGAYLYCGPGIVTNNVFNLGGNNNNEVYGMYDNAASAVASYLYHNTVYIGGSPAGSTKKSYGLYSANTSGQRSYQNNVFYNGRSSDASNYAAYFNYAVSTNLALSNNDYYAPGTGGVLGYYGGANKTLVPLVTGLDANSRTVDPLFVTNGSIVATDYKPASTQLFGVAGTGVSKDYTGVVRAAVPTMGAHEGHQGILSVYSAGVKQADYGTLKEAFDAINAGTHTGALEVRIDYNTTETASAVLNATGSGSASYTAVHLYPTASAVSIGGNLAAPLIDLNGADNVTIDGRVNGTGSARDLTIVNTSTAATAGTSTIRFIGGATNNTVNYCTLKGSETATEGGVVFCSTSTSGGNNYNVIDNNNITNADALNEARPVNAVYSAGSASANQNKILQITGNNFYDFLNKTQDSYGVNFATNTIASDIIHNRFYETTPVTYTGAAYRIINGGSVVGIVVESNIIGGNSSGNTGTWAKPGGNNTFYGISMAAGGHDNYIGVNTISNMSWTNSGNASWYGIYNEGIHNEIGQSPRLVSNTIGSATGTGSIIFKTSSGASMFGIYSVGASSTVIGNIIGSITTANTDPGLSTNFTGIYLANSTTAGFNLVGSKTTEKSIQCSSPSTGSTQNLIGISAINTDSVSNNTVCNLYNASSATTGMVQGIYSAGKIQKVNNNTITNLSIDNHNMSTDYMASVGGLVVNSTGSLFSGSPAVVSGNTIYSLSNSSSGHVIGLFSANSGTEVNQISKSFIHTLSSASGDLYGMKVGNGNNSVSDNILNVNGDNDNTLYGVYDNGTTAGMYSHLYHNTIYVGGSSAGTKNSYCLYSASSVNSRDYRNNLFYNDRSLAGKNYAAKFDYSTSTNLTLSNNDYYVSSLDSKLGAYAGADVTELPLIAGLDAGSVNDDPQLVAVNSTVATDFKPMATTLVGVTGTGITADYGGTAWSQIPTMGAWRTEILNMWQGTASSDWNTAGNWSGNFIPVTEANILFAATPINDLVMDKDRVVTNIKSTDASHRLVTNGHKLTIKGSLQLSSGAQLDASSANSTVEFAGTTAQVMNADEFYNHAVYNLNVNNTGNVMLSGNLTLLNKVTSTTGYFDAITNSPTVSYAGNTAQRIEDGVYFDDYLYNLTVDNAIGLTDSCKLTVANNLTINAGKLFTIAPATNLMVMGTIANAAGINGFVINSTEKGTGSLNHSTDNVPATVKRFFKNNKDVRSATLSYDAKHLLSSPVTEQAVLNSNWAPTGTHAYNTGYDLYALNEETQKLVYSRFNASTSPMWDAIHPENYFVPGRGYVYSLQADTVTKAFRGNLGNGNVSYPITAKSTVKYNLVGNPYPSTIDWKADVGFDRSMLAISGGVGYDVQIWNPKAKNYGVYNSGYTTDEGTNEVSRYIDPMQAFYVQAVSEGMLTFNNNARSSVNKNAWKVISSKVAPSVLSVKVSSVEGSDEVRYMFTTPADEVGARKLFSFVETAPSLYLTVGGTNYATSYLADSVGRRVLPLEFKAGNTGSYTLKCAYTSNEITSVLLEDRLEKTVTDLTQAESYSFKAKAPSDNLSRFVLYINTQIPDKTKDDWAAKVYRASDKLIVDLSALSGNYSASVMDVGGKVLLSHKSVAGGEKVEMNLLVHGVYIVTVNNDADTKVYKVVY